MEGSHMATTGAGEFPPRSVVQASGGGREEAWWTLLGSLCFSALAGVAVGSSSGDAGTGVKAGALAFALVGGLFAVILWKLPLALAVMRKELGSYYTSALAYLFIIVFLVVSGMLYYNWYDDGGILTNPFRQQADLSSFFRILVLLLLVLVPALTMRLWAEEHQAGTYELLFTLPLKDWEVVLGKYLAGAVLLLAAILGTFPVPLFIYYLGDLDLGPVVGGYFGVLIASLAFLSFGAFVSSLTRNQIFAFIFTVVTLGAAAALYSLPTAFPDSGLVRWLAEFSPFMRFEEIARGVLDLRDLVYFLSMTVFFITANTVAVGARRWWS